VRLSYDSGVDVLLPSVDSALACPVDATVRRELEAMSIDDITIFFDLVGANWRNPSNHWHQIARSWSSRVTGIADAFVTWDINLIGMTLQRAKQYDFIESDLGDPLLLDEWLKAKSVYYRCLPKGVITHSLVGNVPLASLFAIYRSLVTKNVTITKVSRRDPVMPLCFANCIVETDPQHPVARALSVGYWEPECATEDKLFAASDAVSVWGRAKAVESVKRRLRYGVDLIEFGPKKSFDILLAPEDDDWPMTGLKTAYDVVAYNQEGCFSSQEVYCKREHLDDAVEQIAGGLAVYADMFRRPCSSFDLDAYVQRARLDAQASGWDVISPDSTEWTIIVTDGPTRIAEHPLLRTLFVHPIDGLADVVPFVDRDVQSIGIAPWTELWHHVDQLVSAGADRVVPIGRMARFRPGFIHDGFRPMSRMVRWVCIERNLDQKYRFMTHSRAEDEERIYRSGARSVHETK
jgi:long-chain-fatty-acyl-CoA reductase